MAFNNEFRHPRPALADSPDLPHVRPLERIPSDLSQTSTMVESEPTDDRLGSQEPLGSDARPAPPRSLWERYLEHSRNQSMADVNNPDSDKDDNMDYDTAFDKARDYVRELHIMCDPIVDLVNTVNERMGAAERLSQVGQFELARRLFLDVLRDVERFKFGTS